MKKHALSIAVILAILLGFLFLRNYLFVILLAGVVAFTFYPVYQAITRWTRRPVLASWLTVLVSIITLVIPITIISYATIHELQGVTSGAIDYVRSHDPGELATESLRQVNSFLGGLSGGSVAVSFDQIRDLAGQAASYVGSNAAGWLTGIFGSVSSFITMSIIYLYVFTALLTNKQKLVAYFRALNPLGDRTADLYLSRASAMTKAMVRGQFVIAILQGLVSALLLYIAGIQYFWVAAIVLSFLSLIPLGAGIITMPIGIVLIFMGNIWQGIMLLVGHFLLVSNIDNVLRPLLVPKTARLNPALVLLSVFAGVGLFGILGIVLGPVIMILIVTTIEVYAETNAPAVVAAADETPAVPAKRPRRKLFRRTK